jgi:hypothetical protein
MKKTHPFLSLSGFGLMMVLIIGLGLVLWTQAGQAFSPGQLSAKSHPGVTLDGYQTHADFETQCERCHAPLRTEQADLCLDCHREIAGQIDQQQAVHGQLSTVRQCRACHPDHRGRDFDPTSAALDNFDHRLARFNLLWHQVDYDAAPMDCSACHTSQGAFEFIPASCDQCHAEQQPEFMRQHKASFGPDCLDCHDGSGELANFDHSQTKFPLDGEHLQAGCIDCHQDGQFTDLDRDCAACHTEAESHAGVFDIQCDACHLTSGWLPVYLGGQPFDHVGYTGFSLDGHRLDYNEQPLVCLACHTEQLRQGMLTLSFDPQLCSACHTDQAPDFMQEHQQQFGRDCLACHDGTGLLANFDHSRFFILDGGHAELDCVTCHADQVYQGTPSECSACHLEPEIHLGWFGLDCENCHTTTAWQPASMRFHSFPLTHGESGEVACDVCHIDNRYIDYTCYGCHEHKSGPIAAEHLDEGISAAELVDCVACHPNGLEDEAEGRGDND